MNLPEFVDMLDAHGAAPARWPAALRADAERLLAADANARAALAREQRLAALVREDGPASDAATDRAARRVMTMLAASELPPQHGGRLGRWWPAELFAFDLTLAWPRVAALAGVCVLGFALGITGLDTRLAERTRTPPGIDVSTIVFEPDPGLRP